jgi:uncharacterized repeat protein (TIGR03803 family)
MKTKLSLLVLFLAAINTYATSFNVLYNFNPGSGGTWAGLTLSGNLLYGAQIGGGINRQGGIFSINTNGYPFTNFYSFTTNNSSGNGAVPYGTLVLSGNTLYGTANIGGANDRGTVFRVNTDGSSFTNLHNFTSTYLNENADGGLPVAGLVLSGNMLYGTAEIGGYGVGTVFGVSTDGTVFTNLHSFLNTDGSTPVAGLVLSGQTLFGTTSAGGGGLEGTIFRVNTDGTSFTNLYNFTRGVNNGSAFTNTDGVTPWAGSLVLVGNTLYGTCEAGGFNGNGTVFAINTDGTGFTNYHNFGGETYNAGIGYGTNTDGDTPLAGLALSGNTLYGSTQKGGSFGSGTIYAIHTDGTGFANLHSISKEVYNNGSINNDGYFIYGSLVPSGNILYGSAYSGGPYGLGTIFSVTLPVTPVPLNFQFTAGNLNLRWSDPAFFLYAAPAINGPYVKLAGAVSPYTAGVTNAQQFFKLESQ